MEELKEKGINEFLVNIKKRLETQDGRTTAHPIFVVYDWEKVPSCSDYTGEWEYIDGEEGTRIGNTKEELVEFIKDADMDRPEDATKRIKEE